MNKSLVFLTLIPAFLLSSCFKDDTPPPPLVPPTYEEVTLTDQQMSSNLWTWSIQAIWNKILSFEMQNNKFVIDKDLDNFTQNYSVLLKSKDLNDNSYIGFKFESINSISMDYKIDIERALQTKIQYTKKPVSLDECIIDWEWSEKWKWTLFVKDCKGVKYLVQLLNEPYENKEGKKEIWYKAYPLTPEIRKFLIQEYFDFENTLESFDTEWVSKKSKPKTALTYNYDPKSKTPFMNGNIVYTSDDKKKIVIPTKRTLIIKDDYIVINDVVIDNSKNYDTNFEIVKSIKLVSNVKIWNLPNKFKDFEIFEWIDAKYNQFLLFKMDNTKKKYIEFKPRFPDTMYVKAFVWKSFSEVNAAITSFENNFSFKKGYETVRDYPQFTVYSYSGETKRYTLVIGKNEKKNKEYAGKYVYAETNKDFLITNMRTYMDLIGKLKWEEQTTKK